GRMVSGRPPRRLRRVLVVCQVALATLLLAGAGLVGRSLDNVLGVDPGFPVDNLLTMRVAVSVPQGGPTTASAAHAVRFIAEAVERLAAVPGVSAAGAIQIVPMSGRSQDQYFEVEGIVIPPGAEPPNAQIRVVVPGYFEALRAPLLRGRTF